jgi:hypothetical protein
VTTTIHDCLTDPCPICVLETRLDFATDKPWTGGERDLTAIIEHLIILRSEPNPDAKRNPPVPPTRERRRPALLAAISATRHARPCTPPTARDYFSY